MDFPLPCQGQPPLSPLRTGSGLWMFWIKEEKKQKKQMQINKDPRGYKTPKTVDLYVKTNMTTDATILYPNKVYVSFHTPNK